MLAVGGGEGLAAVAAGAVNAQQAVEMAQANPQVAATAAQAVPAPPTGEVSIIGRIQPSEDAPETQPGDLPDGQVTDLSVPLVAGAATAYPGFVTLVESTPAEMLIQNSPGLPVPFVFGFAIG